MRSRSGCLPDLPRLLTRIRGATAFWHRFLSFFSFVLFGILVTLSASCTSWSIPGTVKIALVAPFEGYYRATGYDAIYAARLAVREINAAGGIRGWRLELVAYDDRGELELAQRSAQSVTMDPEILAVLGHYLTATTVTAGEVYVEAQLPYVVLGAWTQCGPTVWHLMPSPDAVAEAMALTASAVEGQAIVEGAGPVADALQGRLSPSASVQPAVVYSTMPAVQAGEWVAAARAQGWGGVFIGDLQLADSSFMTLAGTAVVSSSFVTPYPFPRDLTDIAAWTEAYRNVGPHVPEPGIYALPTYEAVYVVAEAMGRMLEIDGGPSRTGLNNALGQVDREGLLGRLRLDADACWTPMQLYRYHWRAGRALPQLVSSGTP